MGGSFTDTEYSFILENYPRLKTLSSFIETGTYMGDTTRLMSKYFLDVYTFEINSKLFIESQNKSLDCMIKNTHHYLGNSYDLLNKILKIDTRGSMFFLDAHQSGRDTSNNGVELVPLYKELDTINRLYPKQFGVVCIDDYRLWNCDDVPHDWKHITNDKIFKSLSNHKLGETFTVNDRLYIFINE